MKKKRLKKELKDNNQMRHVINTLNNNLKVINKNDITQLRKPLHIYEQKYESKVRDNIYETKSVTMYIWQYK